MDKQTTSVSNYPMQARSIKGGYGKQCTKTKAPAALPGFSAPCPASRPLALEAEI